jgi:hypothetical protein
VRGMMKVPRGRFMVADGVGPRLAELHFGPIAFVTAKTAGTRSARLRSLGARRLSEFAELMTSS